MNNNIFFELAKLAEEKNISPSDLILSGMSPEQALEYLKQYQPPKGFVKSLAHGLASGVLDIPKGLAYMGTAIPVVGEHVAQPIVEQIEEWQKPLAPSPEEGLGGKIGYTLGSVLSWATPGLALKGIGAVGKLGKVAEIASKSAEPFTKYAIPTIFGALGAEEAYRQQPAEMPEDERLARAGMAGAIQAGAVAIPIGSVLKKMTKAPELTAPAIQKMVAEGKAPSMLKTIAREAGIHAITFPTVTGVMEVGHRIGVGEDLETALLETVKHKFNTNDTVAEAIVGGLLGVPAGIGLGRGLKTAYDKVKTLEELKKTVSEVPKPEEARPEAIPTETKPMQTPYAGLLKDMEIGEHRDFLNGAIRIIKDRDEETGKERYIMVDMLNLPSREDLANYPIGKLIEDRVIVTESPDAVYRLISAYERIQKELTPYEPKTFEAERYKSVDIEEITGLERGDTKVIANRFHITREENPATGKDRYVLVDLNPDSLTIKEQRPLSVSYSDPIAIFEEIGRRLENEKQSRPKLTKKTAIPEEIQIPVQETKKPEPITSETKPEGVSTIPDELMPLVEQTKNFANTSAFSRWVNKNASKELKELYNKVKDYGFKNKQDFFEKAKKYLEEKIEKPVEEIPKEKIEIPSEKLAEKKPTEEPIKEEFVIPEKPVKKEFEIPEKPTKERFEEEFEIEEAPINKAPTKEQSKITTTEQRFLGESKLIEGIVGEPVKKKFVESFREKVAQTVNNLIKSFSIEGSGVKRKKASKEIAEYGTIGREETGYVPKNLFERAFEGSNIGKNISTVIGNFKKNNKYPKNIVTDTDKADFDELVRIHDLLQTPEGRQKLAIEYKDRQEELVDLLMRVAPKFTSAGDIGRDFLELGKDVPTKIKTSDSVNKVLQDYSKEYRRLSEELNTYEKMKNQLTESDKNKIKQVINNLKKEKDIVQTKKDILNKFRTELESYDVDSLTTKILNKIKDKIEKESLQQIKDNNLKKKYLSFIEEIFNKLEKGDTGYIASTLDKLEQDLKRLNNYIKLTEEKSLNAINSEITRIKENQEILKQDIRTFIDELSQSEIIKTYNETDIKKVVSQLKEVKEVFESDPNIVNKIDTLSNNLSSIKKQKKEKTVDKVFDSFVDVVKNVPIAFFHQFHNILKEVRYNPMGFTTLTSKDGKFSYSIDTLSKFERWSDNPDRYFEDAEKVATHIENLLNNNLINKDSVYNSLKNTLRMFYTENMSNSVLNYVSKYLSDRTKIISPYYKVILFPETVNRILNILEKDINALSDLNSLKLKLYGQDKPAGFVFITFPDVPKISAKLYKYLRETVKTVPKEERMPNIFDLYGVDFSGKQRFAVLSLDAFLKNNNLIEAIREASRYDLKDILFALTKTIRGDVITGTSQKYPENLFNALESVRITEKELTKVFKEYSVNDINSLYVLKILDSVFDYRNLIDFLRYNNINDAAILKYEKILNGELSMETVSPEERQILKSYLFDTVKRDLKSEDKFYEIALKGVNKVWYTWKLKDVVKQIEKMLPSNVRIEIVDKIKYDVANREAIERWGDFDLEAHIVIRGETDIVKINGKEMGAVIKLALGDATEATAYHEAFHAIQRLVLTKEELNKLSLRYPDKDGVSSIERQANAFAEYALRRQLMPAWVVKIFEKIKAFLKALGDFLRGKGWNYNDVSTLFEEVFSGKLKERIDKYRTENDKYNVYQVLEKFFNVDKSTLNSLFKIANIVRLNPEKLAKYKDTLKKAEEIIWNKINDNLSSYYRKRYDFYKEFDRLKRLAEAGRLDEEHILIYEHMKDIYHNTQAVKEYSDMSLLNINNRLKQSYKEWWDALGGNTEYPDYFRLFAFNKLVSGYAYVDNKTKEYKEVEFSDNSKGVPLPPDPTAIKILYDKYVKGEIQGKWIVEYLKILDELQQDDIGKKIRDGIRDESGSVKGTWILFRHAGELSSSEFANEVKNLVSVVKNTDWCLKTSADSYLMKGNLWIFIDDKRNARVGIQTLPDDNRVSEIRGILEGQAIEPELIPTVLNFAKSGYIKGGERYLQEEKLKQELMELRDSGNVTLDKLKEIVDKYGYGDKFKEDFQIDVAETGEAFGTISTTLNSKVTLRSIDLLKLLDIKIEDAVKKIDLSQVNNISYLKITKPSIVNLSSAKEIKHLHIEHTDSKQVILKLNPSAYIEKISIKGNVVLDIPKENNIRVQRFEYSPALGKLEFKNPIHSIVFLDIGLGLEGRVDRVDVDFVSDRVGYLTVMEVENLNIKIDNIHNISTANVSNIFIDSRIIKDSKFAEEIFKREDELHSLKYIIIHAEKFDSLKIPKIETPTKLQLKGVDFAKAKIDLGENPLLITLDLKDINNFKYSSNEGFLRRLNISNSNNYEITIPSINKITIYNEIPPKESNVNNIINVKQAESIELSGDIKVKFNGLRKILSKLFIEGDVKVEFPHLREIGRYNTYINRNQLPYVRETLSDLTKRGNIEEYMNFIDDLSSYASLNVIDTPEIRFDNVEYISSISLRNVSHASFKNLAEVNFLLLNYVENAEFPSLKKAILVDGHATNMVINPSLAEFYRLNESNIIEPPDIQKDSYYDANAEFRSVYTEVKNNKQSLSNPETFKGFIEDIVSRAVGKAYVVMGSSTDKAIEAILRNRDRITGFATKLQDEKFLGIILDNISSSKELITTVGHEIYHLVEPNIPETDKKLLYRKFKNTEDIAEAFGKYVLGKYQPPSFAKRVFDAMRNLWERIVNLFRGAGFTSARDVFDKIEAGKYVDKAPSEIPLVHFVDAMEMAKRNPNFRQYDWDIAFRDKSLDVESKVRKASEAVAQHLETVRNIIRGTSDQTGVPESLQYKGLFKTLYSKARDIFMLPIRHPVLVTILDKAKASQRYIHDIIMPYFEIARNNIQYLTKDPVLNDVMTKLFIKSDEYGTYFTNFEKEVRDINPNLTGEQIRILHEAYDSLKKFTDRVYITDMKEGFKKMYEMVVGQINYDLKSGRIAEDQANSLRLAFTRFLGNVLNDVFHYYDFKIENGKRVVDGEDRRNNLQQHIDNLIDTLTTNTSPEFGIRYNELLNEFRTNYGKEPSLDRKLAFLNEATYMLRENPIENKYASFAISLMNLANKSKETIKELDNGFYFPRTRGDGNYELRVLTKVERKDDEGNPTGEYYYTEIEYWDSQKEHTELRQKESMIQKLKEIKSKYGGNIPVFDTAKLYTTGLDLDTFIKNNIQGVLPDAVIISGRKAPKSKSIIYQHSPSELLSFLTNLSLRANDADLVKELKEDLPIVLSKMYADINFAVARKLHRRRLPIELENRAIAGYKTEDISDTLDKYAIRMQGHLTNTTFLTDILGLMNSPEFREMSIKNPEIKDLIDKQISLLMSPNTRLADFVYKLRALTAFNYLGLRVSSALLNYANTFVTFLPEFADIKSATTLGDIKRRVMYGLEEVMRNIERGEYYESISRNKVDFFKKYPEAFSDLIKGFKEVERFVNWKVKTIDVTGREIEVPVLDRWNMKVNVEPIKKMLEEAQARGDVAQVRKLSRDYFILEGIRQLIADQTIESNLYNTLRLEGMNLFGKTLNKVFDASFFLFKNSERHARTGSAIALLDALYNKVSEGGKDTRKALASLNEAVEITSRVIDSTFFRYDRLNRYWWTNPSKGIGAVLSMPTTLRGFLTNFFSTYFSWFERGQWDKVAMSLAPLFILGGLGALPAVDDILKVMENVTGKPIKLKLYKTAKNIFGDDIAQIIIKGVPSSVVDLSTSLKVEAPFLPHSFDFNGFAELFFGVHRDMLQRITEKGLPELLNGELLTALTYLAPMGIGMPAQAYLLSTEGLRTKYGRQIADIETGQPFTLTTEEALIRALGFRPARLAEIQDLRYYGTKISKKFEAIRTQIYKDFRDAKTAEDYADLAERVKEFNQAIIEYKGAIAPITAESIRRAMKPDKDKALLISKNLLQ